MPAGVWSELPLSGSSKVLVALVVAGFVMLGAGFTWFRQADTRDPPGVYDPNRYYEKDLARNAASTLAGLGALVGVSGMVLLGVAAREIDPQVRRGLLVGAGLLLIGIALLLTRPAAFIGIFG